MDSDAIVTVRSGDVLGAETIGEGVQVYTGSLEAVRVRLSPSRAGVEPEPSGGAEADVTIVDGGLVVSVSIAGSTSSLRVRTSVTPGTEPLLIEVEVPESASRGLSVRERPGE